MRSILAKQGAENKHFVLGFDKPKVFFAATQGERMLYSYRDCQVPLETFTPPAADVKTLNDLVATGMTYVHNRKENYTVEGEPRDITFKRMTANTVLPPNSISFYVPSTGLTPQEAIVDHGFRFLREDTNPKFGKVLVFHGEHPMPQLAYPITFHLAPAFGYRVVYATMEQPKEQTRSVWTVNSLVNIHGYWLPEASEESLQSTKAGVTEPELVTTYKFFNHSVNDVTDAMLEITPKSGDYEWHQKNNTSYKVGANGERIFLNTDPTNSAKAMWPGWLFTASLTSLLVLTIVAYVRWKQQQL